MRTYVTTVSMPVLRRSGSERRVARLLVWPARQRRTVLVVDAPALRASVPSVPLGSSVGRARDQLAIVTRIPRPHPGRRILAAAALVGIGGGIARAVLSARAHGRGTPEVTASAAVDGDPAAAAADAI
jgi:hypothetical protein